ncbi:LHFPL tetraspan subfamily member 2a protein-like [Uloborus diversus]|nr:LHFPL tetraspan subfamily member 2a protein-like isoform X2 [Uloborus diversus]XP_054712849.1 LHFPL tetraspan subfamily member 2a protein-like isoform X2 [Uloborus diversus]XP_054712946.1 LHFPL tetraspan subfamily member 2a protein-like [Uloborus diversus]
MCNVIVTSRTLLWCLLTIATTLAMLAAVVTPTWLIGAPRRPGVRARGDTAERDLYSPSLGIYNRCIKIHEINRMYTDNCAPFVTSFAMPSDQFPNFWKASLIFFGCGLSLMLVTLLSSILGCCVQSIFKKSIFTVSGTIQAIAGLFYILGLMLYPAGWNSRRVHLICGDKAEPFNTGDCTLGLAFYLAIGSTLVTFICSVLSVQAEVSTSTDKVQEEILEGKTLICLL